MEVATEFVVTGDILSLFKTTQGCEPVRVWMKVVFDFVVTSTSNKSCEHH